MKKYFDFIISSSGRKVTTGSVSVLIYGTATPASLFSDAAGTVPIANPVPIDSRGYFEFYAADGRYSLTVNTPDFNPVTLTDIVLDDPASGADIGPYVSYTPAGAGAVATTVQAKLRESVSVKDFGAVGDGVTDDSAPIASLASELAATSGKTASLAGKRYLTTSGVNFDNLNNVEFIGPGLITNGADLFNFPADDYQRVIGQEYLAAFHKQVVTVAQQYRIKVFGDSRPAGNSQTGNFVWHLALQQAARRRGYLRGVFENNAVGGSTIQDWTNSYIDTHLDGVDDPHLIVFCAGINDLYIPFGPATPEQVVSRLDALLTKIRVTKNYPLASLAVAVVVPVSAYNPSQGRDPRFIEPLRTGFKRLARKHQVCLIDGYGVAADGRNQRGLGYAADIGAPEVIHQNNTGMIPILAQLIDAVLPDVTPMIGGGLSMESGSGETFAAAALPSSYPIGISLFRAAPGGGGSNWPVNGFVKTLNFVDDIQVQYNFATDITLGQIYFRKGRSNAWGVWIPLSFDAGVNVTAAAGFVQPGSEIMRTVQSGSIVTSDGYLSVIPSATIPADTTIGTIALGYRPASTLWGVNLSAFDGSWQHIRGRVNQDGTIVTMDAVSITASRIYMNGNSWQAAAA